MNSFAVLDTETTGLSPLRDRILQIGVAVFRDGQLVRKWSTLVNPQAHIPTHITEITGITNEHVKDAPDFTAALIALNAELPADLEIVAYNADFDQQFVAIEALRGGQTADFLLARWFCPYALAKFIKGAKKFDRGFKLTELCEKSNIAFNGNAHDAGNDAEACGRLFLLMQNWLPPTPDEIYSLQLQWLEQNQ